MGSKSFVMDVREDGSGRLSLSYRREGGGISRLACELAAADVVQLALFSEACGLRDALGRPARSGLELDGLILKDDPAQDMVHMTRKTGFSEQQADVGRALFQREMAGAVDICLARAEQSRHGAVLAEMLTQSAPAAPVFLPGDDAEQALHRLREMALILLAQAATDKDSELAGLLRAKKTREAAQAHVAAWQAALADSFFGLARV